VFKIVGYRKVNPTCYCTSSSWRQTGPATGRTEWDRKDIARPGLYPLRTQVGSRFNRRCPSKRSRSVSCLMERLTLPKNLTFNSYLTSPKSKSLSPENDSGDMETTQPIAPTRPSLSPDSSRWKVSSRRLCQQICKEAKTDSCTQHQILRSS
jgi:hypothetical protein